MLKVKFENSKDLLRVLATVENILKANKQDNDLKYIKLENINNTLHLVARNHYMRLGYYVSNVLSIEGDSILCENKVLNALLNVMDGVIEISGDIIKNDKCTYTIPSITAENYPVDILPQVENRVEFDTLQFKTAVENVIAATDVTEGVLSGVYLDNNKFVGCDQKRIFMNGLQKDCEQQKLILSKELLNEVLRLPFEDKIYMSIFGQNTIIEDSNLCVACNLIAGKYPKYDAVLPKDIENQIIIKKSEFEYALNLVTPIVNQDTGECIIEFQNGQALICAKEGSRKAETSISITNKNEIKDPKKIKFNIKFLNDMLRANGEDIDVTTYSDNIGVMFRSGNSEQYIMPLIQ